MIPSMKEKPCFLETKASYDSKYEGKELFGGINTPKVPDFEKTRLLKILASLAPA